MITPSPEAFEELNYRLEAIETQRNRALADAAISHGKLVMAQAKIIDLQKEIEQFKNAKSLIIPAKLAALTTAQEA